VRDYSEAEALVNCGLENRAIAPTLMNATSSRSHTVLTLSLEQRGGSTGPGAAAGTGAGFSARAHSHSRMVRSKLLLVDLAGSERVRRTVSKGARLNEARSINTSLSALGNVIAALAEEKQQVSGWHGRAYWHTPSLQNTVLCSGLFQICANLFSAYVCLPPPPSHTHTHTQHIPYRDSKLTRLLQDSLGGTASTALVATVGPSSINYGETLSTMLFAARCMAVKTTPVQHEEVDYPEMCTRLQARVAQLEGQMAERALDLQGKYEGTIAQLRSQLEVGGTGRVPLPPPPTAGHALDSSGVTKLLKHLADTQRAFAQGGKPKNWLGEALQEEAENSYLLPLLGYAFSLLRSLSEDFASVIAEDAGREAARREALIESFAAEAEREAARELEFSHFAAHDPLAGAVNSAEPLAFGSHLAALSRLEALTRVEGLYRSPGGATSAFGAQKPDWAKLGVHDSLLAYDDPQQVVGALGRMHSLALQNMKAAAALLHRKDMTFAEVKAELVAQQVERRQREEEVVNWSCILKYLLSASTQLRRQLKHEQQLRGGDGGSPSSIKGGLHAHAYPSAGYQSAGGTPQSVYAADFSRLEAPQSSRSTRSSVPVTAGAAANDSPLHRVRQRMSYMQDLERTSTARRSSASGPAALQGRLAQTGSIGSITQQAWLQNNVTLHAAQQDAEEEIDQLSAVHGFDDRVVPQIRRGSAGRSTSPIIRGARSPALVQGKQRNSPASSAQRGRSASPALRAAAASPAERTQAQGTPSGYARDIVRNLGVQGPKASAAAAIVDKVVKLTAAQLNAMDTETREQVLRVRRDLGLGDPPQSRSHAASPKSVPAASERRRHSHRQQSRVYGSDEEEEDQDYSQI